MTTTLDAPVVLDSRDHQEVFGLVPAAGQATRIEPLPCSKELFPIGSRLVGGERQGRPKVACHYLLEKMQAAGIAKTYIVLTAGKWDIPAYLGDGGMLQMHLAYLMVERSAGVPYTLDQAYPFVRKAIVAFGFPDILFQGDDAFRQLLSHQASSGANILLGLFPTDQPETVDMVDVGENRRVRAIVIQPRQTRLKYSWDIAVWTPAFTQFLHAYLADHRPSASTQPELSVGHVIQAAIGAGLRVEGVPVADEPYFDIGTPGGLARALKHFAAVL
jgi:glucose-1-phosphate thymidylyltransferase